MRGPSSSSLRPGTAAFTGVFLFTLLMVSREGMETALLLMQLRETMYLAVGAVTGIVGAAGVAWLWSLYGHKVNLALFFQVTAIFLFVFVAGIAADMMETKAGSMVSAILAGLLSANALSNLIWLRNIAH